MSEFLRKLWCGLTHGQWVDYKVIYMWSAPSGQQWTTKYYCHRCHRQWEVTH